MKRTRLVRTGKYVVAVEIELVVPPDDPSEPCLESETVEFLRQVEQRARKGDVKWLQKVGKVYQLMKA